MKSAPPPRLTEEDYTARKIKLWADQCEAQALCDRVALQAATGLATDDDLRTAKAEVDLVKDKREGLARAYQEQCRQERQAEIAAIYQAWQDSRDKIDRIATEAQAQGAALLAPLGEILEEGAAIYRKAYADMRAETQGHKLPALDGQSGLLGGSIRDFNVNAAHWSTQASKPADALRDLQEMFLRLSNQGWAAISDFEPREKPDDLADDREAA